MERKARSQEAASRLLMQFNGGPRGAAASTSRDHFRRQALHSRNSHSIEERKQSHYLVMTMTRLMVPTSYPHVSCKPSVTYMLEASRPSPRQWLQGYAEERAQDRKALRLIVAPPIDPAQSGLRLRLRWVLEAKWRLGWWP